MGKRPPHSGGGGWPALRKDGPARLARARGGPPELDSLEARQRAMRALLADVYAASARTAVDCRLRTAQRMLAHWGLVTPPLTVEVVLALAASLKAGRYRSAKLYLSAVKLHSERMGYPTSDTVNRHIKDATRSCERGQGGNRQAGALPFDRLSELPSSPSPWVTGGPLGPSQLVLAGAWWLTREIELSNTRACHISFAGSPAVPGQLVATWCLPASKADPQALGENRVHGCTCEHKGLHACPAHALYLQRGRLAQIFPGRFDAQGSPDPDLPLFPDRAGAPVSKEKVVETIRCAARHLGLPAHAADGEQLWTGHSLRVTGAQGLTRAGLELWALQLLGRWGSSAILGYVASTPLASSHKWAPLVASGLGLEAAIRAAQGAQQDRMRPAASPRPVAPAVRSRTTASASVSTAPASAAAQASVSAASAAALVQALRAEVSAIAASVRTLEANSTAPEFVKNDVSGVVHRIRAGDPHRPPATWVTTCGWYFGKSACAQKVRVLPVAHKLCCERCLPAERSERKARAAEAAIIGGTASSSG
jgi:hypothetical protein